MIIHVHTHKYTHTHAHTHTRTHTHTHTHTYIKNFYTNRGLPFKVIDIFTIIEIWSIG